MQPVITLKNLSKWFATEGVRGKGKTRFTALERINLEIYGGEIFVLVGPSGSGKSTLLRIMSGLELQDQGSIEFSTGLSQRHVAFVFQQFALLPWLTVQENIELGLVGLGIPKSQRHYKVVQELKRFGLEHFSRSYPKELSGGMKQRVGIARAFAVDPKIIFMDEPFSELDSFTAQELREELLQIWQERKPTIVLVTHLIPEALELGDRIAVLTPLPGKIERVVKNDLPRPRQKRSEVFFRMEDELYKLVKP